MNKKYKKRKEQKNNKILEKKNDEDVRQANDCACANYLSTDITLIGLN